jgi:translation initiation factor IF-3
MRVIFTRAAFMRPLGFLLAGFAGQIVTGSMEVVRIAKPDEPRINEEIRAPQCRLIGVDGSQLGFFSIKDAQRVADDQGLDLVEIAPNADPPVCRVMNYGKYKYEQAIKAKAARKNQVKIDIKEMKFRPKIDVGDYETKKKHIERFISQGSKVKITIMFRGREIAHPELGLNMLEKLAEDLKDVCVVEAPPKLEGRNMHMLVAPIRDGAKASKAAKDDAAAEAESNEE